MAFWSSLKNGDLSAVNQAFFKHLNLKPSEIMLQDYRGALAHLPEVMTFIRKTLQKTEKTEKTQKTASPPERIEIKPQRGIRQSQSFPAEPHLFDAYASPLTIDRETRGRVVVLVDVTEAEKVREEIAAHSHAERCRPDYRAGRARTLQSHWRGQTEH